MTEDGDDRQKMDGQIDKQIDDRSQVDPKFYLSPNQCKFLLQSTVL